MQNYPKDLQRCIIFLMAHNLAIAVFICFGIGSAWIVFLSYSIIVNSIAFAIGVVFPTIAWAVTNPMSNISWWGMLLALIGFILVGGYTVLMGHEDLSVQRFDGGVAYLEFTGISVVAVGIDIVLLYVVVSFFANLGH